MTAIKICGIKSLEDGVTALGLGADMLGFVFYQPVARYVEPAQAAEIIASCRSEFHGWKAVGVFVNAPAGVVNAICHAADLDLVQLAGSEPPEYCRDLARPAIKVLRSGDNGWTAERLRLARAGYAVDRFMVDSHVDGFYGGTGTAGDWPGLAGLLGGHILAGGLRPDNVGAALALTGAWGVDVSSGVECDGRKHPELMRLFVDAVRTGDVKAATQRALRNRQLTTGKRER